MDYLPLFARLTGIDCLIVGGGAVALRKTRLLLRAGARLTVMAPEIISGLRELGAQQQITLVEAAFAADSITDYQFIVAATGDAEVNRLIAAAAAKAMRFCNVVDDRELSTAIMPAVVDRSPLLIAVSTAGTSPVLATMIRQQLEATYPPVFADLASMAGKWRTRIQDEIADPDQRRYFWQGLLENELLEKISGGDLAGAEGAINAALEADDSTEARAGIGWIVGAGPGDPELLTLKAARILRSADVILHDRLVSQPVLNMARRDADFISVGKTGGKKSISQAEINSLLVELVQAGKRVCRLKGGDPFIFGRGGEEIAALHAAGLAWEVVPGITAAAGSAAAAGLPLTHRSVARSLVLTTAQAADDYEPDWEMLSRAGQTVVFYMAVRMLDTICERMIAAGAPADCTAVIIENGSTPQQRVIRGTLATLPARAGQTRVVSPALLIIGAAGSQASVSAGNEEQGGEQQESSADIWSAAAPAGSAQK